MPAGAAMKFFGVSVWGIPPYNMSICGVVCDLTVGDDKTREERVKSVSCLR